MFDETVQFQKTINTPLVALVFILPGEKPLFWQSDKLDYGGYRAKEFLFVTSKLQCPKGENIYFGVYDKKWMVELSATLGLCQTFGVCIILSSGAYFFSKITSDLVIDPIENMIERVKHITSDPLSAVHEEEERLLIDAIKGGFRNLEEDE